jgi:hypothetical protein
LNAQSKINHRRHEMMRQPTAAQNTKAILEEIP